jgi:NADH-quinone oxidoreductase subunit J
MNIELILFTILALLTLSSAIAMVSVHRPIDAALSFIITLISLAGIFALLHASFLFVVQIIIYAGAILTLILFIIMFLNIKDENLPKEPKKNLWLLGTSLLTLPFTLIMIKIINSANFGSCTQLDENFGSIEAVGKVLYSSWVLPFELISILLLVALVGAITLAKREESDTTKRVQEVSQKEVS